MLHGPIIGRPVGCVKRALHVCISYAASMHTVITGLGRTGTSWLAAMLASCAGPRVEHEPFGPGRPGSLEQWAAGGPGIAVNSYAQGMICEVDALLAPRWIIAIRDFVDVVASAVERPAIRARHAAHRDPVFVVRSVARMLLGDLEVALAELEHHAPAVWRFADFTTPAGFARCARSLGLDPTGVMFLPPQNATGERLIPIEVVQGEAEYIRAALAAMPRCAVAHSLA